MRIMSRVAEELSASYDGVRLIESELYPALRVMKQESQWFYRGADKSLARPGRKQPTATVDFDFHISYL